MAISMMIAKFCACCSEFEMTILEWRIEFHAYIDSATDYGGLCN